MAGLFMPVPLSPAGRCSAVAAALLLIASALPPTGAQAQVTTLAERAAVDELMADYHGEPGAVFAVVRQGTVIFAEGYGVANLEHGIPLGRETVLDIGSVAKQFTAFAIALLADEGALSLDDDIQTHLPEVPDFGDVITIRHMVHHMSGLREIYTSEGIAGRQNGDAVQQADALRLTEHMHELNFTPGDQYLYCNTAYMMLADIVARASGMPFPQFMEERVFGPVGMHHTTIMSKLGQSIPGVAESYSPDDEGFVRVFDNSSLYGAGGMYSTVDDLALWMNNYATAAVGGPAVIEQMQEQGVLNDGEELSYAFGINVGELRGERVIRHTGSSAGFRASFTYFPELDGGVITLSNRSNIGGRIPAELLDIFFGDRLDPAPAQQDSSENGEEEEEPAAWSPSAEQLASLAGTYYSAELQTIYTLYVEDGMLMGAHRRHGTFELEPMVEEMTFEGPGFFGTATFENDGTFRIDNGRVLNLLFTKVEFE